MNQVCLYKILILFLLCKSIFSSFENINTKSKILQSNNTNKYSRRPKVRKESIDYETLIPILLENSNISCKLFIIKANYIINSKTTKKKDLYFIELDGKYEEPAYYFYEVKEQNITPIIRTCNVINISYDPTQVFTDYYKNSVFLPDYLKFFNKSMIIKSIYDPINKDPCYQVNLDDYYENLLKDNKNELLMNKVSLCDDGCDFEGLGIQEMEIKCFCQERIDMDKLPFKEQIANYFKNFGNMDVLKCYKLFFNKKGQKENYLSEIIIFLLIINIIALHILYFLFL